MFTESTYNGPAVSVIVPVYNIKPFLCSCIDSILAQSFKNFELIIIDDGSTDGSEIICDAYAKRDRRIRVFHQENSGVSSARNLGVKKAKGQYISFVDSDDMIHPQMYELLVPVLASFSYPFIHCLFHRAEKPEEDGLPRHYEYSIADVQKITSEEGMLKMMDWKNYGHYIFKGLYRAEYIRNIEFPLGTRWEDVIWSGKVVCDAKEYGFVPYALYSYRMHPSSLVHTWEWRIQKQYFRPFLYYLYLTRKFTPDISEKVELLVYESFINRYCICAKNISDFSNEQKKDISNYAKECEITVEKIIRSDFRARRKVFLLLSMISFSFACDIRRRLTH